MPESRWPLLLTVGASASIFLLFLLIGLASGIYWWFLLWIFVLLPPAGYRSYRVIYVEDDTSETTVETVELLEQNKLNF